jgi:hypothetical protein
MTRIASAESLSERTGGASTVTRRPLGQASTALAISLADLAMGYGFWMLRPWSWQLAFALVFISPVWEIVRFLYRGADPLNLVVAIVFAGIWLYFLNLPSIRTIFGAPTSGFPIVGHALDPILGGRK